MKGRATKVARIAFIAGLYAALTIYLQPISYGPLQVRISEALTILPIFFVEAVPGLFLGCLIANIFGPFGIYDIVFGSLLTLTAAFLTYRFRKKTVLAFMSPVVINALGVSAYLTFLTNVPYFILVAQIAVGEFIAVVGIGSLLYATLLRLEKSQALQTL
ncbi:MAG: QueT transporter family protein [Actinobacteria bacterium]|nr:QueT transporter family protein [Actinomycetota bacterium]